MYASGFKQFHSLVNVIGDYPARVFYLGFLYDRVSGRYCFYALN